MKIQLNKVCFGLPMKSFFVDYTVSKKRELPVVKEFVIRLIHSLNSTTLDTIQGYFGFSNNEILAIIEDLQEENLILWEAGKIQLTYYAMSKFTEENGGLRPTFFEVSDEQSAVEFELYDFRMLSTDIRSSQSQSFSISLTIPDDCYRKHVAKAQKAFDDNFGLFRELVLKEDIFSEVKELYKINNVSERYDAILPLDIEYFVDSDSPDQLKMEYVSSTVNDWDENKSLFSLMDSTIRKQVNPSEKYKNFLEYISTSSDPFLSQYWDEKASSINISALVNHYENGLTKLNDDTFMLIGNFYTEQNSRILIDRLKQVFQDKAENSGLVWLTNSESKSWGKTSDLNDFIESIYDLFDKRKKTSHVSLGMVCKSFQEALVLKNQFWQLENAELIDLPIKFGGGNTEYLLIPNIMVASLFHIEFDGRDISFPIGYVSFDFKHIFEFSKKLLEWVGSQPKYNDFFDNKDTEENEKSRNKYFLPILEQCSLT